MKRTLTILAVVAMTAAAYAANNASDNGSNYGAGWTDTSNGGTGFNAWSITANAGSGSAGTFIGDPASAGISGMSVQSFGLYANPGGSSAFVNADRSFDGGALSVGQTFSFQWGINWDSDAGNKGFNLYSGGVGGTQLVNVNHGAFPGPIYVNGSDSLITYGTQPMTWSFTLLDPSSLQITATDRSGGPITYNNTIAIAGAPDTFRLYADQMGLGDQRQPYFNNFAVVPEPSTMVMAVIGALGLVAARRRMQK